MESAKQFKNRVESIIDTLELHTSTRAGSGSKQAVVEAYKSLYLLKSYFEKLAREEKMQR